MDKSKSLARPNMTSNLRFSHENQVSVRKTASKSMRLMVTIKQIYLLPTTTSSKFSGCKYWRAASRMASGDTARSLVT